VANKTSGARANNAPRYTVLIIAPSADLPNADAETQRIINTLHPEVLLGRVTVSDVLDCVQSSTFDIIWFLGHSSTDGLELSDGILSPSHLAQILRQSPPSLVVLNSCSSLHTAMRVHDDVQAAVICTVLDVPDVDAYITGASLANVLAQGLDINQAYQVSRPSANRQYILLNGTVRLNGANELDDLKRLVTRTAADLHAEIAGMARATAAMQRQLEAIQQEQARVRAELTTQPDKYAATLTRRRAGAWAGGFALFLLAYAILEFREVLDVPIWVALGMSLFVAAVSFWLFVYGIGFRIDRP